MNTTDETAITERLQAKVDALRAKTCSDCDARLCGHEILFSVAMGLGDKPRCAACLADGLGRPASQLRDHLRAHFRQRNCYGEVWRRESTREGFDENSLPGCLWSETEASVASVAIVSLDDSVDALEEPDVVGLATEAWDAGEMACGDLVLALRGRMNALTPGTRLKLTAHDPGAPEDIPAWCRMTGHKLLVQHHPHYWIQRKE